MGPQEPSRPQGLPKARDSRTSGFKRIAHTDSLSASVIDTCYMEQSLTQLANHLCIVECTAMTNCHLYQQVWQNVQPQQQDIAALQELTDTDIQCNYANMLLSSPIFDVIEREEFCKWLESLKTTCIQSGRDIYS